MKKTAAIAALSALLVVSMLLCSCSGSYSGIDRYESDRTELEKIAPSFLPPLDSLGEYESAEYTKKHTTALVFDSDGYALFVRYGEDAYEEKKEEAILSHSFHDKSNAGRFPLLPLCDIEFKGYRVNIVPLMEEERSCKSFGMIGFNDDNKAICYLQFYDADIDTLGIDDDPRAGYKDFLSKYFEWK